MSVRIVQLTDLHLYRDEAGLLAGVPTWATFRAVLDSVSREQDDFDYLVLTGDLAQDEALDTYGMLREALGDWIHRCRIIPGNHDDRDNLREVFPDLFSQSDGPLTFALDCGGWRVIGLDSHVPGKTSGHIDSDQLRWLRTQLGSSPGCPALLFVHHPPIPIKVDWLDEIGLEDADEFVQFVKASPQIKAICAGHVHQEFAGQIAATAVYTTPSTCVQFGARSGRMFDSSMAGYRVILLGQEGYLSEVHRLAE